MKISTGRASGAAQNHGAAIYDAINSESSGYGSQHRFKIAGTDCFTIGYNGDFGFVGINDNVPYPDSVGGNTVNTCLELGSPSGTDTSSVIKFIGRDGSGNANKCQIQWAGANNRFDITVNGNQALQIQPNKDVEVTDGNLVIGTSGHGIDFSATAGSPSNGGEILDDYEEGNFTASLGGLSNWSSYSVTGQGHYVKIGKAVHININFGNVDLNNSASGSVIIFNLPFVPFVVNPDCRGVTSNYMAHKVQHANDGMIHSFYIHPTYGFKGQITKNNTSWTSWDASNFTATGVYLDFSATYFTAS